LNLIEFNDDAGFIVDPRSGKKYHGIELSCRCGNKLRVAPEDLVDYNAPADSRKLAVVSICRKCNLHHLLTAKYVGRGVEFEVEYKVLGYTLDREKYKLEERK
jgi:hypothetical protein